MKLKRCEFRNADRVPHPDGQTTMICILYTRRHSHLVSVSSVRAQHNGARVEEDVRRRRNVAFAIQYACGTRATGRRKVNINKFAVDFG